MTEIKIMTFATFLLCTVLGLSIIAALGVVVEHKVRSNFNRHK